MADLKIWKNEELQRIKSESDSMFDRLCSGLGLPSVCRPLLEPAVQMTENSEEVLVEAHLPGMKPEDIEISVTGDMLSMRCDQRSSCACTSQRSVYKTRFRLPCKVRTDEVEAELDNDVVRIRMPKCRRPEPRRIPVKIKKTGA